MTLYFPHDCSDNATDAMSSTAAVIVNITDVNDLPPVFDPITSPLMLPEDMSPGQITTVMANDGDSGTNGEVRLLTLCMQHFGVLFVYHRKHNYGFVVCIFMG